MADTNMLEIAKNLRLINKWRLGNDERLDQPKPADISRWLDAAADALELGVDAAEARESASAYAHLLAIACSDLEQKSGQLWHATWEANYIEEAIREFEAVKCELLRQVDRLMKELDEAQSVTVQVEAERSDLRALRARVAELEAEIERWRTATAKLRDGADEAARVANEQLARIEARAELWKGERDAIAADADRLREQKEEVLQRAELAEARAALARHTAGHFGDANEMIEPADPFPCRSDLRRKGTDYRSAPAKHPDSERLAFVFAHFGTFGMRPRESFDEFIERIDAARQQGGAE